MCGNYFPFPKPANYPRSFNACRYPITRFFISLFNVSYISSRILSSEPSAMTWHLTLLLLVPFSFTPDNSSYGVTFSTSQMLYRITLIYAKFRKQLLCWFNRTNTHNGRINSSECSAYPFCHRDQTKFICLILAYKHNRWRLHLPWWVMSPGLRWTQTAPAPPSAWIQTMRWRARTCGLSVCVSNQSCS